MSTHEESVDFKVFSSGMTGVSGNMDNRVNTLLAVYLLLVSCCLYSMVPSRSDNIINIFPNSIMLNYITSHTISCWKIWGLLLWWTQNHLCVLRYICVSSIVISINSIILFCERKTSNESINIYIFVYFAVEPNPNLHVFSNEPSWVQTHVINDWCIKISRAWWVRGHEGWQGQYSFHILGWRTVLNKAYCMICEESRRP